MTDIEIGTFLAGQQNPEQLALLRVIGSFVAGTDSAKAEDDRATENTGREWSDTELTELGNMLMRGLSIQEIARQLRREHGEVRGKIVEVARVCRTE